MRPKAEEEARLAEGARMKVEEHEHARLEVALGVHLAIESIWREKEEEEQHAQMKAGEEARLVEESRLKPEEDLRMNSEY